MSPSTTCTYRKSAGKQPPAAAMAVMLAQARSSSSSNVPVTNFPSASSAGMPLMYTMPFSSLARLNGKPAGSPGPEPIRLIVMTGLAGALLPCIRSPRPPSAPSLGQGCCRCCRISGVRIRRQLMRPPGQVPGLAGPQHADGQLGGAGDGQQRSERGARECQRAVDLIADDRDLVAPCQPDQGGQFVRGMDAPDRVVRVAQDIRRWVGGE